MPFPATDNPLLAMTPRQREACAHRLPDAAGCVVPLSQIGDRMGVTKVAAQRLIDRGLRQLAAAGYDPGPLRRRLAL